MTVTTPVTPKKPSSSRARVQWSPMRRVSLEGDDDDLRAKKKKDDDADDHNKDDNLQHHPHATTNDDVDVDEDEAYDDFPIPQVIGFGGLEDDADDNAYPVPTYKKKKKRESQRRKQQDEEEKEEVLPIPKVIGGLHDDNDNTNNKKKKGKKNKPQRQRTPREKEIPPSPKRVFWYTEEEVPIWEVWFTFRQRLAMFVAFLFLHVIVLVSLRPMDRMINFILGPEDGNGTTIPSSGMNISTYIQNYKTQYDIPTFEFSLCNAYDGNATYSRKTLGQCCNGLANICALRANQVMFATMHNAMATKDDGSLLYPNHYMSLESALDHGFRGLHLELCKCQGVYEFCRNGLCRLGARNPLNVFMNIDRFLSDHKQEVLVVLLHVNHQAYQPIHLEEFYSQIMSNETRFARHLFVRRSSDDAHQWPTLKTMIQRDKRILLFHNNERPPECEGNTTTCEPPPGMYSWNAYGVETKELAADTHKSIPTTCGLERAAPDSENTTSSPKHLFFSVNQYLATPPRNDALAVQASETLNHFDFLSKRVDACSKVHKHLTVNLVSVDFWNKGNVVEFVQRQNNALG